MLYRFEEIHKSYGPHDVLQGATWQHNAGERVGLVGRNGAGKTTLFRLLLKQDDPDRGTIIRANGLRIGHLQQHLESREGESMFDFVLGAFADVLAIEAKMRQIEHDLADPAFAGAHDRLLEKYSDLQHEYEHADGYTLHSEVERVLTGVGFSASEWDRPIREFSGGQQNRAMLARVLLAPTDVLLLDEPTNHLDLNGIEFLEEFLSSYKGSYLVISHDRTFLNRTVNKVVELTHGKLVEYHGTYDRFVEQRAERMEQLRTEYERQQQFIDRTEEFIRKNIAGQKTKQAQSRRKMLARLDEVDRPQTDETLAKFRLDAGPRSGAIAIVAERLDVGYKEAVVRDVSLSIRRGERYAIMGPNGSGKSTLLKTIAGRIMPLAGDVRYGHNIQVGYYDQTLGDLLPEGKVLDEIWDLDHTKSEEEVRNYLARFSFFGEDVFKTVRALSGGEKGRLALAKIMYVGGNVMLLDEPTNHLDVYTREALEEALEGFTGALVVVSHDRYFVDRVAEHIILVEDGEAEVHNGNYSELVEKFKQERVAAAAPAPLQRPRQVQQQPPLAGADRKTRDKRLRKIDSEIADTESAVAALERQSEEIDALLCSEEVYRDGERVRELQATRAKLQAQLAGHYARWDELGKERETLGADLAEPISTGGS